MSLDNQTTSGKQRVGLWLESLDVLFFRDGRPFSAATRVRSGPPMPQTLAGAIWTALLRQAGCDFPRLMATYRTKIERAHWEENLPEEEVRRRTKQAWEEAICEAGGPKWIFQVELRGPWFARLRQDPPAPSSAQMPPGHQTESAYPIEFAYPELARPGKNQSLEVLVPVPAVLYKPKGKKDDSGDGELLYASPLPAACMPAAASRLPGWRPPLEGLRPVWIKTREDMELASGYLTLEGLCRFLRGETPESGHLVPEAQLFDFDHRTGIGIQPDQLTSEESQIYAISLLALQKGVGFYAELVLPGQGAEMLRQIHCLRWGGESRNVLVEQVGKLCQWPNVQPAEGQKPFLLLTTPGLFAQGWLPACLEGVLAAAAVPGETAVSGWDLARRGPKPARFAAAAGSVYFLHQLPTNLPEVLSDLEEDRQQGWGCYLQGVWDRCLTQYKPTAKQQAI